MVVALADLASRFPNVLEPWTANIYNTLEGEPRGSLTLALPAGQLLHEVSRVCQSNGCQSVKQPSRVLQLLCQCHVPSERSTAVITILYCNCLLLLLFLLLQILSLR
jgi:hypothetical protein